MCDFQELESWPGARVGRCGVCGVHRLLVGAIEISHRDLMPLERFAICAGCRATALNRQHRSVAEGALRARIADGPDAPCRHVRGLADVGQPSPAPALGWSETPRGH